ncbi:Pyridoxal-dependent decarboxylase domain-containing protein 1 [Trichostrongylus colubriformis]|uniref:Pyridoxal-dependent decarboxylase domain-containing protein 1 n=1 Tax=Trichostrongylus colubriformis TaxID=6319 RepID=A0AAN8GDH1_TRICO
MISSLNLPCTSHVLHNITKIDQQLQHSPGSQTSSTKSNDSGLEDGTSTKNGVSAKPLSRMCSRMSQSNVSPVLEQLQQLIISDEWVGKDTPPTGHPQLSKTRSRENQRLSELGRTLVTSSSLKAYIDLLNSHHRQSIASWLYGNTSQALSQQFRFPESNIHCSEPEATLALSVRNGIGHAIRLALKDTYGNDYITKGWKAFVEKGAPVVYVTPALHMDLATYIASEFGISDVVLLPKLEGDMSEIEGRIDHHAFERILEEDVAAGRTPLLVIAVVGSTILGQNDMVSKLLETRKKHRFWLHAVGQAVAALTLREPTEVLVHVLTQVDSVTLPLALWLGVPAAPVVTLYRAVEGHKPSYREKLDTLPWWVVTQTLTSKGISDIIENAYLLCKVMLKGLSSFTQIEVVGMENAADFVTRVYKNQYTAPTVLIFKYRYNAAKEAAKALKEMAQKPDSEVSKEAIAEAEKHFRDESEYGDSLNSWLGQGVVGECQSLGIHMIELGGTYGTAYRFCPLEHAAALSSHVDHVQQFIRLLGGVLKIVDSTVAARENFEKLKSEYPSLVVVPVHKWAGVGAVCYVPSIVSNKSPSEWDEKEKQQISHMNLELVHQLRSVDSAFSAGESSTHGLACVKFGMLSDAKDLADLLKMVAEKGAEIETNQQYLDSLAELIRQGIEAANEDLKKENDLRLQQEGVIRQLPIMGSLVNWWSPIGKDGRVRGRFFNLNTGEIQTTDVIYKHKKETIPTSHGGKSKASPAVANDEKETKTAATEHEETVTSKPTVEQPMSIEEK